jgi:dihydrofolate synthase/folylpolyglutamate synthase
MVAAEPTIVIDGAHNVDSMVRLVDTIQEVYAGRPVYVVLGTSRDKDAEGMLRVIAPIAEQVFAVQSANPRAWEAAQLGAVARSLGLATREHARVLDAISAAREAAGPEGVVLVAGSLYVAAEAREALGLATSSAVEHRLLYG